MAFFRINKKKQNFVILDKAFLQDVRLSWKSKGLLAYLLSLPDDWRISARELVRHASDGKDTLYGALRELGDFGYILRESIRVSGRFQGVNYVVFERPQKIEGEGQQRTVGLNERDLDFCANKNSASQSLQPSSENPREQNNDSVLKQTVIETRTTDSPYPGFPDTVKPHTDKPDTENPTLLSNDITKNNENKNKITKQTAAEHSIYIEAKKEGLCFSKTPSAAAVFENKKHEEAEQTEEAREVKEVKDGPLDCTLQKSGAFAAAILKNDNVKCETHIASFAPSPTFTEQDQLINRYLTKNQRDLLSNAVLEFMHDRELVIHSPRKFFEVLEKCLLDHTTFTQAENDFSKKLNTIKKAIRECRFCYADSQKVLRYGPFLSNEAPSREPSPAVKNKLVSDLLDKLEKVKKALYEQNLEQRSLKNTLNNPISKDPAYLDEFRKAIERGANKIRLLQEETSLLQNQLDALYQKDDAVSPKEAICISKDHFVNNFASHDFLLKKGECAYAVN